MQSRRVGPGGSLSRRRQRVSLGQRAGVSKRSVISAERKPERLHSRVWLGFRNSLHQCSLERKRCQDSTPLSRIGSGGGGRGWRWLVRLVFLRNGRGKPVESEPGRVAV